MALLELTYEMTPEQEQSEIHRLCAPLVTAGLPNTLFQRDAVLRANYTYKGFMKHLQTVARLCDQDMLVNALTLGVKRDFYQLPNMMTITQFCKFAEWLRSRKGQAALHEVQRVKKIEKKAQGVMEPRDVALQQIFAAQRADWASAKKEERRNFEKEILELRNKIRRLERQWENRALEIDNAFDPYGAVMNKRA